MRHPTSRKRGLFLAALLSALSLGIASPAGASNVTVVSGQSINTAYHTVAASGGGVVYVSAGSYPDQTISRDPVYTSAVSIAPVSGASPVISRIDFGNDQTGVLGPTNVTIESLNVGQWRAWSTASNITANGIIGKNFEIDGGSGVTVNGGSYGSCDQALQACINFTQGSNILVKNVEFHNVTSSDLACCHVDAVFVRGCANCTFDNNYWHDNQITNVRVQNCCGLANNSNVHFLNDWFGTVYNDQALTSTRIDAVDIDTPTPGLTFTSSTFRYDSGLLFEPGAGVGAVLTGNSFRYVGPCSEATYNNNTTEADSDGWGDQLCGTDQWGVWMWRPWGYTMPSSPPGHH